MGSDFNLPETDPQVVRQFQKDYLDMNRKGDKEAPHACFRFVWALVHSPDPAHVERGLDLAQSMIKAGELEQQGLNDLVYLCAVAQYRRGSYQAARTQINEYLKVSPSSHQAAELKSAVDDAIVKEGLIGVGVGTGLLTVAAVAIGLLMSKLSASSNA
ncbi:hypothetical protein WJX77_009664 [Trebouxia sp. C0004]